MRVVPTERPSYWRDGVQVWSLHAADNPKDGGRSAEHAHAADRFAREIEGFLTLLAVRSRRLMGNPLARSYHTSAITLAHNPSLHTPPGLQRRLSYRIVKRRAHWICLGPIKPSVNRFLWRQLYVLPRPFPLYVS